MGCENSCLQAQSNNNNVMDDKGIHKYSNQKNTSNIFTKDKENYFEEDKQLRKALGIAKDLQKNHLYKQALKQYSKINLKFASNWEVLGRMGDCYRFLKNYEEAIKWLLQSYNKLPHEYTCNSLSICYRLIKDYENSIKYANEGILINRKCPNLYNSLGNAYIALNKHQEAQTNFMKAIELYPSFQNAYFRLSQLYVKNHQHTKSLQILQQYLKIMPNNLETLFQIALLYKNSLKKTDLALDYLHKCIEIDPRHAESYNTLGNIHQSLKSYDLAEQNYKKSIQIKPNFAYPYNGLGNNYYFIKRYQQSIKAFEKAIEINETYSTPYSGLGDSYRCLGDFKKAIQSYQKSIQLNPKDSNPHNGLAFIFQLKGNLQSAVSSFTKSIQINPKSDIPYNGLGNIYKQLRQYEKAISNYLKALEFNPHSPEPYNGLGNLYQKIKKYQQSQKWYRKSLQINPKYQTALVNLANQYNKLKRYNEAENMYLQAYTLNLRNEHCCNNLGKFYSKKRVFQKAIQFYNKAIQINPSFSLAHINLSMTLIDIQNYQQAFMHLKQAKEIIQTSQYDVFSGCKSFINDHLSKFQIEMPQWQFKIKQGYLNKQDKKKISNLRSNFQKTFKNMFNPNQGQSNINPNNLNSLLIDILQKIREDEFSLSNIGQIAHINYKMFQENNDYFNIMAFLFCKYFCLSTMIKQNSIIEIERYLNDKLQYLTQQYPLSQNVLMLDIKVQLKQTFQIKKVNMFHDVEYFKDYMYLVKEIQEINNKCIVVLPQFKEFVYKISSEEGGYHAMANLKIPEKQSQKFKVYIRIMEKMFKQIANRKSHMIQSIQNKLKESKKICIQGIMGSLIEVWTDQINTILKERIEDKVPTNCFISDFVRGKAVFKEEKDLERAANRFIDECFWNSYEIVEIDDRLHKNTRDIVFKFVMEDIVCEFQMALDLDATRYNYNHCLYEIKRSPLGCIFGSFLCLSKYQVLNFLNQTKQLESYYKNKKLKQMESKTNQSVIYLLKAFTF